MSKTWIVDGEYYHKSKSRLKRILGEYGFAYNWKEQPKYIWRRDNKRYVEGEFDREDMPDGTVERRAARITYNGPDNPEMFSLIDDWAKGHEAKWRPPGKKEPVREFKDLWRAAFKARDRAPRVWRKMMVKDFREKYQKLKEDLEVKDTIDMVDYMYKGI